MLSWFKRRVFGALVALKLAQLRRVARRNRDAARRLPFPTDVDRLRQMQGWCVDALKGGGALPRAAVVTTYDVEPFATTLAFRSSLALVSIRWTIDGDPDGTLTVVVKMAPVASDLNDHAIYLLQNNHLKEVGFYTELDLDTLISPRCFHASVDPHSGHFCILMEHCDGMGVVTEEQGCPVELALDLVRQMAPFHAEHWGFSRGRPDFLEELPDIAIAWFADSLRGPHRRTMAAIARHAWRHDLAAHQTVIHGDARVGNILFPSRAHPDRFVLYDWQACRAGRGVFDVVYFVTLCMTPRDRRAAWRRLLDAYHAALVDAGVEGYSRETLEDDALNATLLTLFFVTAPLLSKEASGTVDNDALLESLKETWAVRAHAALADLDAARVASWCGLDEGAVAKAKRDAVSTGGASP